MLSINETALENSVLGWLRELGYQTDFGPELSPGGEAFARWGAD